MSDMHGRLEHLRKLGRLLDNQFTIPGTNWGIGLDAIIGLIPVVGDSIATGLSLYILQQAHEMGVPFLTKFRMAWNIFVDWFFGLIPIVGDVFDVAFKANRKNIRLIEAHVSKSLY